MLNTNYKITTLGIFAHANAGKTTLTEQILKKTNVISTVGRVDKGSTVTDSLEVEKNRGITIKSSYVTFNLGDTKVQLIDTPGHVDFSAEVIRAINVLDVAVLVVSGVEKVEVQTKVIWDMLEKRNIPTFIFCNKLDRIGASYEDTLSRIGKVLSKKAIPFNKTDEALNITKVDKEVLAEAYSNCDDDVLSYLLDNSDKELDADWFHEATCKLISKRKIFPVFAGSALKDIGLDEFLSALKEYIPFKEIISSNNIEDFSGYVYMVRITDKHRLTYIKILSGCMKNMMHINQNNKDYKITALMKIVGNDKRKCDKVYQGEIALVVGLDAAIGEIIGENHDAATNIFNLNPMFRVDVIPQENEGIDRLRKALQFMNQEDPLLNLKYNNRSKKFQIDLMGDLQGESIIALLGEKYGVRACVSDAKIIYKESPKARGFGESCYTGFSYVAVRVLPQEEGFGVIVRSDVSESELHKKYIAQVLRLLRKYLESGLYGWEVTDLIVELCFADWDNVVSKQLHFNIATPIALARALKKAGTKLLEPIMSYEITFDNIYYNSIMAAIISFKKTYTNIINLDDDIVKIIGDAYISEINFLSKNLKRMTSGDATLKYYQNGFSKADDSKIVKNEVIAEYNPFNVTDFLEKMGGSKINLDRGL